MQAAIAVSNATMTPLQTEVPPNKLLDLVRKVKIFLLSFGPRCKILEVWYSGFSKATLICLNLLIIQRINPSFSFLICGLYSWFVSCLPLATHCGCEADNWNKSFFDKNMKEMSNLLGILNSSLSFNNRTCTAWSEVIGAWIWFGF